MEADAAGCPGIEVDVEVACDAWCRIPEVEAVCRDSILTTLTHLQADRRWAEVSVVLTDDESVRLLNRDYRQRDKPTNVLSFPGMDEGLAACRSEGTGPPLALGDIVLAAGTVFAEAESQGKPPDDHLRHLVVHGLLHLLGFDHEEEDEARLMEAAEVAALALLGVPDPYEGEAADAR